MELSEEVSALRAGVDELLAAGDPAGATAGWSNAAASNATPPR